MLNGRMARVGGGLPATPCPQPTGSATIDILFVIAPHSLLLDIAGPAEAFRLANLHRDARRLPPRFRLRFAGPVPTVSTSVGLSLLELEPLPESFSAPTWVVLVGQPRARVGQMTPAIAATERWLARTLGTQLVAKDTQHRLLTICSGTLLAARAGLLINRQCTTHHELLDALHALAPQAQVVDDCVFLVDGPFASSAGITAGIDLALHLIAQDCGEALAASVARDMVMYLRRSPRDAMRETPVTGSSKFNRRLESDAVLTVRSNVCLPPPNAVDRMAVEGPQADIQTKTHSRITSDRGSAETGGSNRLTTRR